MVKRPLVPQAWPNVPTQTQNKCSNARGEDEKTQAGEGGRGVSEQSSFSFRVSLLISIPLPSLLWLTDFISIPNSPSVSFYVLDSGTMGHQEWILLLHLLT